MARRLLEVPTAGALTFPEQLNYEAVVPSGFLMPAGGSLKNVLAGFLLLLCNSVQAVPITYRMFFEVEAVLEGPDLIGTVFAGEFSVDDAILGSDGLNKPGEILGFRIEMGETVWDWSQPYPVSDLFGFRGPPTGLGALSPGFDVMDGEIVNLRGGVYSINDAPFVDFSSLDSAAIDDGSWPADNTFNAAFPFIKPSRDALGAFSRIQGNMRIARVAEPASIALLLAGLLGLALVEARRRRAGDRAEGERTRRPLRLER